jgi:hypothetical protein
MSEKLYTKSKALGLDYLKDRTTIEIDDFDLDLNLELEDYFHIDTLLEEYDESKYKNFNYKNYLDVCKNVYKKDIEPYLKKYLDNPKYIISYNSSDIIVYEYESEDVFIKRMKNHIKWETNNIKFKKQRILELIKELPESEQTKLKKELIKNVG